MELTVFEEGCKGMQSAHVYWGGALVMWGQCRQPLVPTSTAEAELTALAEAHLMGKAMSPAIEALLEGITSAPPTQRFQKPLNPFKEGYDKDN